jgi:predicted RNase H-like HicB family nuclease
MRYPVVIEPGTETSAHGVVIPDLPGCFSAGDSLEEALVQAAGAIAAGSTSTSAQTHARQALCFLRN